MLSRRAEVITGLGIMLMAAMVLWWIVPTYVVTPKRVPFKALSPAFWPNIIGWIMLACGAILALRAFFAKPVPEAVADDITISRNEGVRLLAVGAILLGMFLLLPVIGMVWSCMAGFFLLVLMSAGRNLIWGIIAAVLLPLILYVFFTKVAGVAIPQGQIVRLP